MFTSLDTIADDIFQTLAGFFPVCLSSDEFHYFPQIKAEQHDWGKWDDFSADAVQEVVRKLAAWERSLKLWPESDPRSGTAMDISMLLRTFAALREQLDLVRPHESQPTWYLTIAGIGLAEALEAGEHAWRSRIDALPEFLGHAGCNLVSVPDLYCELGSEMVGKLRAWLKGLDYLSADLAPVLEALERFERNFKGLSAGETFVHSHDILNLIIKCHVGCGLDATAAFKELDLEIQETTKILNREAGRLSGKNRRFQSWNQAVAFLPTPCLSESGLKGLYQSAIDRLADHCLAWGLTTKALLESCPVKVEPVPSYLATIRTSAAYSMPPGHPPRGGTFYIESGSLLEPPPPDYILLAAHETYPGHHLLDTSRWHLKPRLRRHMEFPLFYEGWACFAEELLFHTGFFEGAKERMLLAKRRFWRAMRGKADLYLHTGKMDIPTAAAWLTKAGKDPEQALSMVRRYALKPGYQLSYTLGMRRFRKLYERFAGRGHGPADFANQVFALGEIGLDQLGTSLTGGKL